MVHDENTKIDKQVTYEYELDQLTLDKGKPVKVTSADTGGWKLFMKTADGWDTLVRRMVQLDYQQNFMIILKMLQGMRVQIILMTISSPKNLVRKLEKYLQR